MTVTFIMGSRSGIGLLGSLLEGHRTGDLECHFGGVDLVIRTVVQSYLDVNNRITGQVPDCIAPWIPSIAGSIYSFGIAPPTMLFTNS